MLLADPDLSAEARRSRCRLEVLLPDALFRHLCMLDPRFPWRYLAYFHYRSKGWMVRSGVQFGVDYVLYLAHPSKVHSQFSVLVIPTAVSAAKATEAAAEAEEGPPPGFQVVDPVYSWSEIRAMARVQTQVSKRLLLCYVGTLGEQDLDLARPALSRDSRQQQQAETLGTSELESLVDRSFVEELMFTRWNPERNRD